MCKRMCSGVWPQPAPVAEQQRGFTLVELSLALALSGLVLVLLYAGLYLAQRSWDKGLAFAEQTQGQRVAAEFFRRVVQQARPLVRNDRAQGRLVAEFVGQPQRMMVVTPLLQNLGLGGLYWLELAQEAQTWQARLALYVPGATFATQKPRREVLLEHVKKVQLCYWGPGEISGATPCTQTTEAGWWAEWPDNLDRPPTLVRLWLEPEVGVPWPPLTVALMATPSYQASQAFLGAASR